MPWNAAPGCLLDTFAGVVPTRAVRYLNRSVSMVMARKDSFNTFLLWLVLMNGTV
jgi:hypothetical protein